MNFQEIKEIHGVLVVDKPGGMTSAKVVSVVKRALGVKKIGHTGTLDPMATGVLPLCLGEGTKIAGYLLAEDKSYEGEIILGQETDTLDREGTVTVEKKAVVAQISQTDVLREMAALTGAIDQVPPMYSALKQGGTRLYALARRGEKVTRSARSVFVHFFRLLSFVDGRVRFSVRASKGTYVRCLARDLGRSLGCGAFLSKLRRTRSGRFGLDVAVPLETLKKEGPAQFGVFDPLAAIDHMPSFVVSAEHSAAVANGKRLLWTTVSDEAPPVGVFALLTPDAVSLLAIAEIDSEMLRYRRVFNYGLTQTDRSSNLCPKIV